MIKKATHPTHETIVFEEESHVYKLESDPTKKFISGTTFLHQFVHPFDKERISQSYSKKHKLNQEDVLKQWDDKARISRENGTRVHATLEALFLGEKVMICKDNEKVAAMQKSGIKLFDQLQRMYKLIEAEKIVADLNNNIAGMVDLIGIKPDGTVVILDYKTNEKISFENQWQTLKLPVNHLQDTNFNQYSLQLNLYQNIMDSQGYFPKNTNYQRFILHIAPDKFEIIECPDMQTEIASLLSAFKRSSIH